MRDTFVEDREGTFSSESGTVESSVFFITGNTSPGRVRSGMTPLSPKAKGEVPRPLPAQVHCPCTDTSPNRQRQIFCPLAPASSPLRVSGKVPLT